MALMGLWYAGVAALAGWANAAEYWFQLETEAIKKCCLINRKI